MARNFWVGVVSRSHAQRGVQGGFIQLNHGRQAPVQRLKAGDGIAIYSPRTEYPDGAPLQAFTALGFVDSGRVFQVEMSPDFKPYRVDVRYLTAAEAPIRPLVQHLAFIKDKAHWGAPFRFGFLQVTEADFAIISNAMGIGQAEPTLLQC